jgi:hypothetical protein
VAWTGSKRGFAASRLLTTRKNPVYWYHNVTHILFVENTKHIANGVQLGTNIGLVRRATVVFLALITIIPTGLNPVLTLIITS